MSKLVKALAVNTWEGFGFNQIEIEAPKLDEQSNSDDSMCAIVNPIYTGICGTDKGIWFRKSFRNNIFTSLSREGKNHRTIGHEFFGQVAKIGSRASHRYGLNVGDYVSGESHIYCGTCYQCRIDQKHVCTNEKILGITYDGCFSESFKIPASVLWPTDISKIRPEIAAIQEPFGNAVHACSVTDLRGKSVAVFGCGTIGIFTILIAKNYGASRIVAYDVSPIELQKAKEAGADVCIQLQEDEENVNLEKVDVSFEMAGPNVSVNNAIQTTRRGGTVILFGLRNGDFVIKNFDKIITDGKVLISVIGREIFKTWYLTKGLLENKRNEIAEKIHHIVLEDGKNTLVSFHEFQAQSFEKLLIKHPKLLFKF